MPEVNFVFIGGRSMEREEHAINRIFSLKNVHWLGPRPHAQLPACLAQFDVCINPLKVSEHGHRRSPLRLFDYLTTNRPIVSTDVEEARSHLPHIKIAKSTAEFCKLVQEGIALGAVGGAEFQRRCEYIRQNSWGDRARQMLEVLAACKVPGGKAA
jgi:hypothetical protein